LYSVLYYPTRRFSVVAQVVVNAVIHTLLNCLLFGNIQFST